MPGYTKPPRGPASEAVLFLLHAERPHAGGAASGVGVMLRVNSTFGSDAHHPSQFNCDRATHRSTHSSKHARTALDMASQYAFAGNPNAQSFSDHQYRDYGYDDHQQHQQPYSQYPHQDHQQPPSTFSSPHDNDVYDQSEMDRVTRRNTNHNAADQYDEKSIEQYGLGARDSTGTVPPPGLASNNMYGSSTHRNSIWTPEDKHVFFKRSVPARAFRSIFCIVIWAVIIIISVILLVVTFAKPPNVAVMSISVPNGDDFSVSGTSFKANGSVNFAISNPNSFSATIEHLQAHLYDANLGKSVSVGNGTLKSQKIKANDNTTIVFPFDIGIDLSSDATALISDVANQCGLGNAVSSLTQGSSSRRDVEGESNTELAERQSSNQIKVLLEVDARISILSVGVSVPVSKNISIECPTSALQSVLGSLTGGSSGGSSASGLAGLLGGRALKEMAASGRLPRDISLSAKREVIAGLITPWMDMARRAATGMQVNVPVPRSTPISEEL